MVSSIGPSELAFNILKRSMELDDIDVYVFWVSLDKACINHLNACLHYSEAYGFDGSIISTDLDTTIKLLGMPTPTHKYFFLNDIEWTRLPNKNYHELEYIYRNPELKLITRCTDHTILVENCWNVKVYHQVENYQFFDVDFLEKIMYNAKSKYSGRPTNYTNKLTGTTNLLKI